MTRFVSSEFRSSELATALIGLLKTNSSRTIGLSFPFRISSASPKSKHFGYCISKIRYSCPSNGDGSVLPEITGILKYFGVNFSSINVLDDNEIREGIKEYSDWPTIPQIYINNEFIGGCDILREMAENGEIIDLLKKNNISYEISKDE